MAIELEFKLESIDIPSVREFRKAIRKGLVRGNKLVKTEAQDIHRYNHRTRKLRRATKSRSIKTLGLRTYIDEQVADYGKYVHEGHGTWGADRFIDDSVKRNEKNIEKFIIEEIDKYLSSRG